MKSATIEVLSQDVLATWIDRVVMLDGLMTSTMGADFSEIAWDAGNFWYDLHGKWELSRLAISGSTLLGYWISSSTIPGNCHTHRVAVHPEHWGEGIASRMFGSIWATIETAGLGIDNMTLEVGHGNHSARKFYERLGFSCLFSDDIREYLHGRGRTAIVRRDHIEEADGSRFYIMRYLRAQ